MMLLGLVVLSTRPDPGDAETLAGQSHPCRQHSRISIRTLRNKLNEYRRRIADPAARRR